MYILICYAGYKDPYIELTTSGFIENFVTYQDAKAYAEKFKLPNYLIYKECDDNA